MSSASLDLRDRVRDVPDFPQAGIVFKDIMPLVADAEYFRAAIDGLVALARPLRPDVILGAEARGFIFGGALAYELGCGFVTARKPGKLPRETVTATYDLEYGTDSLHVHADAIPRGSRVIVHDDLLATGGTAQALCGLVEQAGGIVAGCAFVIELSFLEGRAALADYDVHSLLTYDSE